MVNTTIIPGALLALATFALGPHARATETYDGNAYDRVSGTLLYRESHYLFDMDGAHQRAVLYRCPDGRAFARKRIREDGEAPDFDMTDARLGYREGVRHVDGRREVYVQRSPGLPEKTERLQVPVDGVIDVGSDEYVHHHWDALVHGDAATLPFLVPSRRMFYTFKLVKVENDANPNPATLTLRLSLSAWYAFLLPHFDVVYDRATRRLLRYEGMSNVRDDALKNYNVRIEFPHTPVSQTSDQVADAITTPLTTSCAVVRADTPIANAGR